MKKFIAWIKSPASDVWLFIIAVVLLNLVASRAFFRLDLTDAKSYSLSEASRETVQTLEEPLSVRMFFSDDLPAPYSSVRQYVEDLLSEYRTAAGRNFSVEELDMDDSENQRIASGYGLRQVRIQEVSNNEVGLRSSYMGLALLYADQIELIDNITSMSGLEYRITSAIGKIVSDTNALSGLTSDVTVTFYQSERLSEIGIAGFDELAGSVQDAFAAVNQRFQGRLRFESVNPGGAEAEALAGQYAIQLARWADEDGSVDYGVLGLVAEYEGKARAVPISIQDALFQYVITGADNLEADLEDAVRAVVAKTSVIAYSVGHGEHDISDQQDAAVLSSILSDTYELQEVNLASEDIPISAQSLIVNGPRTAFSDDELYKIDQFVLRGGNVMFFVDPYDEQFPQGEYAYYSQPTYSAINTGLEKLFDKYGLSLETGYVMDETCLTQNTQEYGELNYYYAPRLQKSSLDQDNPIANNLIDVFFYKAGAIDISKAEENSDASVTVLAKSSPRSWTEEATEGFVLSPLNIFPPSSDEDFSESPLAVLVEGRFESAFDAPPSGGDSAGEPSRVTVQNHLSRSTQTGRVFLASTSLIATYEVIEENLQIPTSIFVRNTVDYMNGKEDYCVMRNKNLITDALRSASAPFTRLVQYFNEVGLAVLVVIAGLCVYFARRRRKERIRRLYSAEDASSVPAESDDETDPDISS